MRVQRVDAGGKVSSIGRTPIGGLVVKGAITRCGVFEYKDTEGKTIREYRSPEEVFSPGSLSSANGATVTIDHPGSMVVPDNWAKLSKGHIIEGSPHPEDKHLIADLAIEDGEAIQRVDSGELVELSCGYSCDVENTPGETPEGETFDRVQKNILYNHVALGPKGWGRGGPTVSLRLDSNGNLVDTNSVVKGPPEGEKMKNFRRTRNALIVQGVSYNCATPSGREQAKKAISGIVKTRMDTANAMVEKKDATLEDVKNCLTQALELLQEMAEATVPEETTQDEADPEVQPPNTTRDAEGEGKTPATNNTEEQQKMDSLVEKRVAIVERARQFLPGIVFAGVSNVELMRKTLDSVGVKHQGLSEEAVYGAFLATPVPQKRGTNDSLVVLNQVTTPRLDGVREEPKEEELGGLLREKYAKASKRAK